MRAARIAIAFALLGFHAASVGADPITITSTITSGAVTITGLSHSTQMDIHGSGFSFVGYDQEGISSSAYCEPCGVGRTVGFSTTITGSVLGGTLTFGDEGYEWLDAASFGSWEFRAGQFVLPEPTSTAARFTSPFTFLAHFGDDGSMRTPPRDSRYLIVELAGAGIATVDYTVFEHPGIGPLYTFSRLEFAFSSTDPVPEPATVLLLGGGLLAVMRRVRGRIHDRRHVHSSVAA